MHEALCKVASMHEALCKVAVAARQEQACDSKPRSAAAMQKLSCCKNVLSMRRLLYRILRNTGSSSNHE
jgi:hypothetical protein